MNLSSAQTRKQSDQKAHGWGETSLHFEAYINITWIWERSLTWSHIRVEDHNYSTHPLSFLGLYPSWDCPSWDSVLSRTLSLLGLCPSWHSVLSWTLSFLGLSFLGLCPYWDSVLPGTMSFLGLCPSWDSVGPGTLTSLHISSYNLWILLQVCT